MQYINKASMSKGTSTIAIILCCLGLSLHATTAQEVIGRVLSKERTPLENVHVLLYSNHCCPIKVRKGTSRGLNRRIEAVELSDFAFQAPPSQIKRQLEAN